MVCGCILGWRGVTYHFWVTDLDLTVFFRTIVSGAFLYIIQARNPKFGVWLHLWMAECYVSVFGSL